MEMAKRILVVDDDRLNRMLLETLLKNDGYDVLCVDSGRAALQAIAASPPALVLLDLMMPGMDGFEVMRQMKCMQAARDIPVVLVTALENSGVRARLANAGAVEVINKPVDRWELAACMEKLLGGNPRA
jgi:CheY-like chemotaxis protein